MLSCPTDKLGEELTKTQKSLTVPLSVAISTEMWRRKERDEKVKTSTISPP